MIKNFVLDLWKTELKLHDEIKLYYFISGNSKLILVKDPPTHDK